MFKKGDTVRFKPETLKADETGNERFIVLESFEDRTTVQAVCDLHFKPIYTYPTKELEIA